MSWAPFALAGIALSGVGCGDKEAPPEDRLALPTFSVNYTCHIRPLLTEQCISCHAADKVGAQRKDAPVGINLDTYDDAVRHASKSLHQIAKGAMPPEDDPLPMEARVLFKGWVAQGTPQGQAPCDAPPSDSDSEGDSPADGEVDSPDLPVESGDDPVESGDDPRETTDTPAEDDLPGDEEVDIAPGRITFMLDIKPLLKQRCIKCHSVAKSGRDRNKAPVEVNFDTAAAPGEADYDTLRQVLTVPQEQGAPHVGENADLSNTAIQEGKMPPRNGFIPAGLSAAERALFQAWIEDGKARE